MSYTVQLSYFKPSGKWYTDAEFEYVFSADALYQIWGHVEILSQERRLPGLQSGVWDGPILVQVPNHPHDHPHLIMPRGAA